MVLADFLADSLFYLHFCLFTYVRDRIVPSAGLGRAKLGAGNSIQVSHAKQSNSLNHDCCIQVLC